MESAKSGSQAFCFLERRSGSPRRDVAVGSGRAANFVSMPRGLCYRLPGAKLMRTTPMVILVSIIVIAIALVGILGMALRAGDKAPAVGSEANGWCCTFTPRT